MQQNYFDPLSVCQVMPKFVFFIHHNIMFKVDLHCIAYTTCTGRTQEKLINFPLSKSANKKQIRDTVAAALIWFIIITKAIESLVVEEHQRKRLSFHNFQSHVQGAS